MYWIAEHSSIGGGCAIKLRTQDVKRRGYCRGNKFEVVVAPPVPAGHGGITRPRFALKSLLNGKLVAPNFRGRCVDRTI
jgi:hypothetical protein